MIVSPDKKGTLDHPTLRILQEINIDVPIVPVNMFSGYDFNEDLYKLDKWVLVDMAEYGANQWQRNETHIWGVNSENYKQCDTDEWRKFDNFIKEKPPIVYFKRELLKKDLTGNIYPIDFAAFFATPPIQTEQEFNNRLLELFNSWGYSHELRRAIHGYIFVHATTSGIEVVDNFPSIEKQISERNGNKRTWATIFTPYWQRQEMQTVFHYQGMSKLSLSLAGAGAKCFRHSEASLNSVMVMEDNDIAWSYDWVDGFNCIKFPKAKDFEEIKGLKGQYRVIEAIEAALKRNDLYEIYKNGVATCEKYRLDLYAKNYLEPIIKKYL